MQPPAVSQAVQDSGISRVEYRPNGESNTPPKEKELTPARKTSVHIDLARVLEAQGNDEAAVAEYQKAIAVFEGATVRWGGREATKQQSVPHRRMAGALDRMGRFAQAETHYRLALKLSPNDANVWNDAGYSYYLQARYDEAERSLRTAVRLDPNQPRIHTNLGLVLAAAGKTDAALDELTKAGGPAIGHANLGYLLAASGRTKAAREHYEKALAIQPDLAAAKAALAKLDSHNTKLANEPRSAPVRPIDPSALPASTTSR